MSFSDAKASRSVWPWGGMLCSGQMSRVALFRFVAVLLLLLLGAELFACESTADGCGTGTSQGQVDDGCLCCCAHVVIVSPTPLMPYAEQVGIVVVGELQEPLLGSSAIYHPPRI